MMDYISTGYVEADRLAYVFYKNHQDQIDNAMETMDSIRAACFETAVDLLRKGVKGAIIAWHHGRIIAREVNSALSASVNAAIRHGTPIAAAASHRVSELMDQAPREIARCSQWEFSEVLSSACSKVAESITDLVQWLIEYVIPETTRCVTMGARKVAHIAGPMMDRAMEKARQTWDSMDERFPILGRTVERCDAFIDSAIDGIDGILSAILDS